jgi:hypothetical protein
MRSEHVHSARRSEFSLSPGAPLPMSASKVADGSKRERAAGFERRACVPARCLIWLMRRDVDTYMASGDFSSFTV